MLSRIKTLNGYRLHSLDGEIGRVKDFYFDDRHWTIRYLVAETGNWLMDRQVLLSPHALKAIGKEAENITIDLTRKQIEGSPSWNSDKPVSRQFEQDYYQYYGWPTYWEGSSCWGMSPYLARDQAGRAEATHVPKAWNAHLRSTNVVRGYRLLAGDGEIGHVEDFIIEDETWTIRYLIVDTQTWWSGKKVLISPRWIEGVSWSEQKVAVTVTREAIRQAPTFTEEALMTRDYEIGLHGHYNRKGYWVEEPEATSRAE